MHNYAFRWFAALLVATGSIAPLATAQAQAPALRPAPSSCGTDEAMRELLGPGYDAWSRQYAEQIQALSRATPQTGTAQRTPSGPRYTIPVVVHIIHTDGADNISDAQVYDAIRILNLVYQERDPDTAGVIPYFKPRIGNANLEFRLAKLDPSGNCTNGITRHYSALTNIGRENVKGLPGARWDQNKYLNLWIVEFIPSSAGSAPGGTAAYAIFPCVGGLGDGVVLTNAYFGSIGRSSGAYAAHTLPHEVGHYLSLRHTWGAGNTPGSPSNCSIDDGIADTPNTIGYQGVCDVTSPSCPGSPDPISNVQNIMDYAGCPMMFTRGQADVMNNGVAPGGFSCRQNFVSAANLTATGIADGQVVPACAPTAYLRATGAAPDGFVRICPGGTVAFEGRAYNLREGAPAPTFTWSFPGGQPATATGATASATYAAPGTYSISLTVADTNGNNTSTRTGYVLVGSPTAGLAAPFTFNFPAAVFPTDPADPFRNWQITNYGATNTTTWEATSLAGSPVDNESVRIRLRNATTPSTHYLYSPNILVSTALSRAYLSFRRAYAPANAAAADVLKVDYSLDCGRTWTSRGSRSATQLRTANATAGIFVPTATQWAADSILLPTTLAVGAHLQVRFSVAVDGGNALYLDALRVRGRVLLGTATDQAAGAEVSLAPNPLTDETRVALTLTRPTRVALRVTDVLGRVVLTQVERSLPAGAHLLPIAEGLRRATAGVYTVTVLLDGATVSRQLLVR